MSNYKIVPINKRSEESKAYTDMLVTRLKEQRKDIKPSTTVQCASTQRLLDMTDEELIEYRNRPLDLSKAIAVHPSKVERVITTEEFTLVESTRRQSKNTLGQSDKSVTTEEHKKLAIEAFTYSQPVPLNEVEIEKLTRVEPIKEFKKLEEWKDLSNWQAFKHWVKGGKVIRKDKK